MSLINITNIVIKNQHSAFSDPFIFKVTFETLTEIKEEIEWNVTYVGSAMDEKHDQLLDSFSMGPLQQGTMEFDLEVEAPDYKKIPSKDDVLGVTALIISVSYLKREFFRAGYYLCNQYEDQEFIQQQTLLEEQTGVPQPVVIEKVFKEIFLDKPRITRFEIDWINNENIEDVQQNISQRESVQKDTHYNEMISEMNALNNQININQNSMNKFDCSENKQNEKQEEITQNIIS